MNDNQSANSLIDSFKSELDNYQSEPVSDEEIRQYNENSKKEREFGVLSTTPIYRVFQREYLEDLINTNKNKLVPISKWDDPFEAFLLSQSVNLRNGGQASLSTFYNGIYGQCWSLNAKESDATWRIYSPKKNGIRVKTTIGKLWDSFYDLNNQNARICFAIGKVNYWDENDIRKKFQGTHFSNYIDSQLNQITETLFIKRLEFEHENEVRILYHDINNQIQNQTTPLFEYNINSIDFIEEMLADPRMYDGDFKKFKSFVNGKNMQIEKSKLYQVPNLKLKG